MTARIDSPPDAMRRLRSARLALGISQRTLAERAGYSREQVCQWELGRRSIKLCQYEDLIAALGVRIELMATPTTFTSYTSYTVSFTSYTSESE